MLTTIFQFFFFFFTKWFILKSILFVIRKASVVRLSTYSSQCFLKWILAFFYVPGNGYNIISCLETDSHAENNEKSKLSEHIDEKTEREIEKAFGKHRRKESPYSIQNVLWLITSIAVFYYTDFYIACRYDQRVNR